MRFVHFTLLFLLIMALGLSGCRSDAGATETQPTPTTAVAATVQVTGPVVTLAVPPLPSAELTTPVTEASPPPDQTDEGNAARDIAIVEPIEGAEVQAGDEFTVRGTAGGDSPVRVTLIQIGVGVLAETTTNPENGAWSAVLTAPAQLVGPLRLQGEVVDDSGSVSADTDVLITNVPDLAAATYIAMQSPTIDYPAVANKPVRFSGVAKFVGETAPVTLAIGSEDCATVLATIGFNMVGSGNWEGFVQIPAGVEGSICATATLGNPNSADALTAYTPLVAIAPAE